MGQVLLTEEFHRSGVAHGVLGGPAFGKRVIFSRQPVVGKGRIRVIGS
jgi:hypothetical protein